MGHDSRDSRSNRREQPEQLRIGPFEILLLLGVVFVFATVFMVYFFGRLPRDSNYNFLLAFFGAPYVFLLACVIFSLVAWLVQRRRG